MAGLILFDCDGTLTDSHGAIVTSMQQAFKSCGLESPRSELIEQVIGLSLDRAIERLNPVPAAGANIASGYRQYYLQAERDLQLFPGVLETLDELARRNYRMGIVTGKSLRGLLRVIDRFDLSSYFEVWRTPDQCHSKPHPDMAIQCMAETGISSEFTSVVGDAVFDMEMASAAGVRGIGVSFGASSRGKLMSAGAQVVVDDFADLLDHFPIGVMAPGTD